MGILFAVSAAAFFSLSHITVRQGVQKVGVRAGTGIMLLSGTALTTIIAFLLHGVEPLRSTSISGVLNFAAAGVIHFLLGWIFINNASLRIGATRVSAMTSVTPLFATLIAFFTLRQSVNLTILGGIILITLGIYAIATSKE